MTFYHILRKKKKVRKDPTSFSHLAPRAKSSVRIRASNVCRCFDLQALSVVVWRSFAVSRGGVLEEKGVDGQSDQRGGLNP